MENAEIKEIAPALYWDTFRSWRDRLPEKGSTFRLFSGHGIEQAGLPVTNWVPYGPYHGLHIYRFILRIRTGPTENFMGRVVEHLTASLFIGDSRMLDLPGMLSTACPQHWDVPESPKSTPYVSIYSALTIREDASLFAPPRQPLWVELDFGEIAPRVHTLFNERGPDADWLEITAFLDGNKDRVMF